MLFSSAANSRNKILATVAVLNPARCAALMPGPIFTVTNPSRVTLYEPLTILPLIGILTSLHRIDLVMHRILVEAAPGVNTAPEVRRIAANIAKAAGRL